MLAASVLLMSAHGLIDFVPPATQAFECAGTAPVTASVPASVPESTRPTPQAIEIPQGGSLMVYSEKDANYHLLYSAHGRTQAKLSPEEYAVSLKPRPSLLLKTTFWNNHRDGFISTRSTAHRFSLRRQNSIPAQAGQVSGSPSTKTRSSLSTIILSACTASSPSQKIGRAPWPCL